MCGLGDGGTAGRRSEYGERSPGPTTLDGGCCVVKTISLEPAAARCGVAGAAHGHVSQRPHGHVSRLSDWRVREMGYISKEFASMLLTVI